jgi:hypothetical protein
MIIYVNNSTDPGFHLGDADDEYSESYLRRRYGQFYWVPPAFGLLILFYSVSCFQGYVDTGKSTILILALFSLSLGLTLTMIGVQSRLVAAFNTLIAAIICFLVISQRAWPAMYLVICCIALMIVALIPRNKRKSGRSATPQSGNATQ